MSFLSKLAEPRLKKAYLGVMAAAIAFFYILTVLLGIVYATVSNNIVYMNSFLMYTIEIGLQLLDLAVYSVAFAFFLYATHRYQLRGAIPFFGIYIGLTALRRVAALLLEILLSGSIGADDVWSTVIYFALDLLTCFIVIAIAALEFKKYRTHLKEWQKLQRNLGNDAQPPALYPFEKLFSRKNPLQVCAIKVAILLSVVKIFSRLIFDLYIGAPTGISDLLIMIIYYLSDILIGVIVYAAMLGLFGWLTPKHVPNTEA